MGPWITFSPLAGRPASVGEQVSRLQLPLVQRTFRRGLNEWLDVLVRWRSELQEEDGAAVRSMRRLAERLADAAETYALGEIERAARAVALMQSGRPLSERLDHLLDVLRREMHPQQRSRRAVIVVSSDPAVIEQCSRLGQPYASRTETFGTVAEARSFLARDPSGLVVLDADLPEDVLGWLAELRQSPTAPEGPVLVLASSGQLRPEALVLGASEFMKKPVAPSVLEAALASHLGQEGKTVVELANDPVTGLPGPALFQEAVADQALRHQGRAWCVALVSWRNQESVSENPKVALLAVQAIAEGLRERFPEPSLVARLDQDTFGVLIRQADADKLTGYLEDSIASLISTAPSMMDLGVGAVVSLEGDFSTVLATARRMQNLAAIAGQRVLLTTLEETPQQKILLVDEDPLVASQLKDVLGSLRAEVVFCRTPVEALETAGSASFALVVLSASLPEHSAFDLLATLRSWPQYAQRPLLVLAHSDADQVRAYDHGADGCLSLPFHPEVVPAQLRALLAR